MSQRLIGRNAEAVNRQMERLASGLRVNRAADDASGLVVSEGMRGELSGLTQNVRNAEHAVDLLQVAEGSMQEVNNMLVRMRSLALQSSSSTSTAPTASPWPPSSPSWSARWTASLSPPGTTVWTC